MKRLLISKKFYVLLGIMIVYVIITAGSLMSCPKPQTQGENCDIIPGLLNIPAVMTTYILGIIFQLFAGRAVATAFIKELSRAGDILLILCGWIVLFLVFGAFASFFKNRKLPPEQRVMFSRRERVFILIAGIVVLLAWSPWIRMPATRDTVIGNNCPVQMSGGACFQYIRTSTVSDYPFVTTIKIPAFPPKQYTTYLVTPFGGVYTIE